MAAFEAAGLVTWSEPDPVTRQKIVFDAPRIGQVLENRGGVFVEVRAGAFPRSSLDAVQRALDVVASHAGFDGLRLDRPGAGQVWGRIVAPWPKPYPLGQLSRIPQARTADYAVQIGVDDDDAPVGLSPEGAAGIMVSGVPGSGKTAVVQLFLAAWKKAGAEIRVADAKDAGDFAAFGDVVGDDQGAAVELFGEVAAEMRARLDAGKAAGQPNWWDRDPGERGRLLVLAVDEAHEYFVRGTSKEQRDLATQAEDLLINIAKRGRAAGVVLVISTQKADSSALPTALRDQLPLRISGQQTTPEAARAALGALIEGAPAPHEIPARSPGRLIGLGLLDRPSAVLFTAPYAPAAVIAVACGGEADARPSPSAERE